MSARHSPRSMRAARARFTSSSPSSMATQVFFRKVYSRENKILHHSRVKLVAIRHNARSRVQNYLDIIVTVPSRPSSTRDPTTHVIIAVDTVVLRRPRAPSTRAPRRSKPMHEMTHARAWRAVVVARATFDDRARGRTTRRNSSRSRSRGTKTCTYEKIRCDIKVITRV